MPSLLLHAENPQWKPARLAPFMEALSAIGLVGKPIPGEMPACYRLGDQFLGLVMFMGCSPQITLDPDQAASGQPFCFVRLREFHNVTCLCSDKIPILRCPRCRAPIADPQLRYFDSSNLCEQCGVASRACDVDWRKAGGYARFFIELSGIYPHEAVPAERLLTELARFSSCDWRYLYR